jgi:hypothetical protein
MRPMAVGRVHEGTAESKFRSNGCKTPSAQECTARLGVAGIPRVRIGARDMMRK